MVRRKRVFWNKGWGLGGRDIAIRVEEWMNEEDQMALRIGDIT